MAKKEIEDILIKFLNKSLSAKELEILNKWVSNTENEQVFKDYVNSHFEITLGMNEPDIDVIKDKVLAEINKQKSIDKKLRSSWAVKLAAAAAVAILISLPFVFNKHRSYSKNDNVKAEKQQILPGSDKATLTLEDGSQVVLEKGASVQTKNANSNGERIVYNKVDKKPAEITYNYLTIPRGGQFYVKLSDGTQVWLNSETQLKYPVSFVEGETRKVELVYGEAYFEVSSSVNHAGAKFNVINSKQEIEVLGTKFNIKAYKDETNIYTTLVEGKVAISYKDKKQNLIPNQQSILNFDKNILSVKTVDVYNEISWKEGIFSFEDKPLKDIMKVLSRWYDMDVIFKNKAVEDEEFIGILEKDQKIEEILMNIKSFGIINDYEIKNKKVVLE